MNSFAGCGSSRFRELHGASSGQVLLFPSSDGCMTDMHGTHIPGCSPTLQSSLEDQEGIGSPFWLVLLR